MNQTAENTLPNIPNSAPKGIPLESIIEYKRKGLTTREIAELLGCSHSNIVQRLKDLSEDITTLDQYKTHRADILAFTGRRMVNVFLGLTDAEQKEVVKRRGMVDYGILYDKERLERGQSTQNLANIHADIEAIRGSITKKPQGIED